MITLRRLSGCVFICLSMFLFSACSQIPRMNIEELALQGPASSHFVLKLSENAGYLETLVFHNVNENQDYEIAVNRRQGKVLLLSVPPGEYYLRRLDTVFEDLLSVRFPKPEELLEFKQGNVYYLGDISWINWKARVDFSKEALMQAKAENASVFKDDNVFVLNHLFGDSLTASVKPGQVKAGEMGAMGKASQGVSRL